MRVPNAFVEWTDSQVKGFLDVNFIQIIARSVVIQHE